MFSTFKMKNKVYSLNLLLVIFFLLVTPAQLNEVSNEIEMDMMENDSVMDLLEQDLSNMTDVSNVSTVAMENMLMTMDKEVKCLGFPKKLFKVIGGIFKPLSEEKVNVQFFLTTRKVREWKEIPTEPSISFEGLDFDPNRFRTIFIVHGFLSRAKTAGWVEDMANALLGWSDVNVIIVDWHSSWRYWRAVGNTRLVGKAMTEMGFYLMGVMKVDTMRLHLIGHSLGAHIVSFMAACLGGVARITGLDPAGPCFHGDDSEHKLDVTDAKFVDVIHTNGRLMQAIGFGQDEPIGHVDFYPNGGVIQPGCSKKFPFSRFINLYSKLKRAICSHGRAHQFFIEGIRFNCTFWGHIWDRSQEESDTTETDFSSCTLETCTEMGMLTEEFPARGSFKVTTKENLPFCSPDKMLDQKMGRLLGAANRLGSFK